jgi:hypothetical protein
MRFMERKFVWKDQERMHTLLNAVAKGGPYSTVQSRLIKSPREIREMDQKWISTENKAQQALSALGYVTLVQRSERKLMEEVRGIDIAVYMKPRERVLPSQVHVHMVDDHSSYIWYRTKIMERIGLTSQHEFNRWRNEHKIIILNSDQSPNRIRRQFKGQLRKIQQYGLANK